MILKSDIPKYGNINDLLDTGNAYTVQELADYCNVSVSQIHSKIRNLKLNRFKVGHIMYYMEG